MLCNGMDWNVSFYGDIIGSLYRDVDHQIHHLLRARLSFREKISKRQSPTISVIVLLGVKSRSFTLYTHAEQPNKDVSHSRLMCGAAKYRSKDRSSVFTSGLQEWKTQKIFDKNVAVELSNGMYERGKSKRFDKTSYLLSGACVSIL